MLVIFSLNLILSLLSSSLLSLPPLMTEVAAGIFDGFMNGEKKGEHCSGFRFVKEGGDDESSESSSIGAESSSDDLGEDDEVQSKPDDGPLGSLESLEESLPIKRGLSNFFPGKSKSFVCLSEIGSSSVVGELAKPENPFNKRRRILNAHKPSPWTRRASCGSLLLPPLTVVEANEDEENDEDVTAVGSDLLPPLPRNFPNGKDVTKAFRSPRSFSLSDLQHA